MTENKDRHIPPDGEIKIIYGEFEKEKLKPIEASESWLEEFQIQIERHIKGQPEAVYVWANILSKLRKNFPIMDQTGPLAVALHVGPSGVGKTETVYAAAQVAYEMLVDTNPDQKKTPEFNRGKIIRIDLAEFSTGSGTARLTGADPGYLGYKDQGKLTNNNLSACSFDIRDTDGNTSPVTFILFDEIEKAHPNVINLFLGMLDYGTLTLGTGDIVNIRNCVVIFTSNLGNKEIENTSNSDGLTQKEKMELRAEKVRQELPPEFLSRIEKTEGGIVYFNELDIETIKNIAVSIFERLELFYINHNYFFDFKLTDVALSTFAAQGYSPSKGVRPLQKLIEQEVIRKLSSLEPGLSYDIVVDFKDDEFIIYCTKDPKQHEHHNGQSFSNISVNPASVSEFQTAVELTLKKWRQQDAGKKESGIKVSLDKLKSQFPISIEMHLLKDNERPILRAEIACPQTINVGQLIRNLVANNSSTVEMEHKNNKIGVIKFNNPELCGLTARMVIDENTKRIIFVSELTENQANILTASPDLITAYIKEIEKALNAALIATNS
ncbi:AAA family ATPase [Patescibacteria group bacterium]|nr:AAA family ATPase [Patescibacteria group bacterium]